MDIKTYICAAVLALSTGCPQADIFTDYTEKYPYCVYQPAIWDGNTGIARYSELKHDGSVENGWSLAVVDDDGEIEWAIKTTEPPPGFKYKRELGQGADAITTTVGITAMGLVEVNPIGFPGILVAKGIGWLYLQSADAQMCYDSYGPLTGLGWGAGAWNIGMMAGAGPGAIVPAVAASVLLWPSHNDKFWACAPVQPDTEAPVASAPAKIDTGVFVWGE